jgi:hypothetical protein
MPFKYTFGGLITMKASLLIPNGILLFVVIHSAAGGNMMN